MACQFRKFEILSFILSLGVDLISGVTCDAPYEWVDKTNSDWEFNSGGSGGDKLQVRTISKLLNQ